MADWMNPSQRNSGLGEWIGQQSYSPQRSSGLGDWKPGDIAKAAPQNPAAASGWLNQFSSGQGLDPNNMTIGNHLFGGTDKFGNQHGGMAGGLFDIGKTGMGVWLGLKQLGLAEDSLDFQKEAFSKQFNTQGKLTNAELRDRQMRRVRDNPNATPVDEYMTQNAVTLG